MPIGTGRAIRAVIRRRGATNLADESLDGEDWRIGLSAGGVVWAPQPLTGTSGTHRHPPIPPRESARMPIGMWMASSAASASSVVDYYAVAC